MNNASHNAVHRPVRPGFSWGGAVAALSLAFVTALGAPASAAMVDDVDFCLSVGKWGPYGPNGPGPQYDTIAFVDLDSWKLVTEAAGIQPISVFGPEPLPWIPVAGDFDGDGFDSILMFNTQDWSLVDLERGPVAPREGSADPQPNPWIPVAGDFDGDGRDSVLVYDLRDGRTYKPEEGPLRIERYDPQPDPWLPVAGDFDGDRIDTIAVYQMADPEPVPWIPAAGDFDGDGIDSVMAFHVPSGKLVKPESELLAGKSAGRSRISSTSGDKGLQLENGCYLTVKNVKKITAKIPDGTGGYKIYVFTFSELWMCCPGSSFSMFYSCTRIN